MKSTPRKLRPRPSPAPALDASDQAISKHILAHAPVVFVTLVSMLIGLALADLANEARSRMVLWPLDIAALRAWAQLFGTGTVILAAWSVYAHVGISRRQLPGMGDMLNAFATPIAILVLNSFAGRPAAWTWFYAFTLFVCVSWVASVTHIRMAIADTDGARFRSLLRWNGFLLVTYLAVPFFGIAGFLDQRGYMPPIAELLVSATALPAGLLFTWWFFRDWRRALGEHAIQSAKTAR